ncbi:TPA: restriction endonuclease subunit S [Streptococcus suis]|nr:restriction endonuclease subunit S [Streptococcus suis]HEM4137473.1 restriction endonuclease subunit S [Streptococcus suis]
MPNKDRNIPKRRFKEFENADAWELRKLGEVAEIVMGQSPDSKNYTDNPLDNILVQGNADLRDGCVVPRVWTTQVTKTAEKGDLILSVRAPVGDVGRTNYNVVLGRGVAGIKGNEFIYHLLVKMKLFGYWTKLSTGSTFESINSDDIKNSIILFPSLPEQEAIGTFFSTLDRHITLHQRKLDKLKSVKQAYLSEMFPAEGERVPKRRFPGFTDAWELRKLGEVAISFDYGLNSAATEYDGENKYLRITDIDDDSREFNVSDLTSPEINLFGLDEYRLSIGDILFARTGASVGKSYIYRSVDGKVYFAGFLIRVKIKDTFNPDFVFQNTLTSNYERFISITSMRSGQPGVNAQEYSNYEIMFPSLPEQEAIGTFFSTLDQHITLHQRKLEKLKNLKKALLNELFV